MVLRPCLVTGTERALEPDHLWAAPVGSCLCLPQRGASRYSIALVFVGRDISGTTPIACGSTSVRHWMIRPLGPSQRAPQFLGESLEVRGSSSEATTLHSLPTSPLLPVFPCCPLPSCVDETQVVRMRHCGQKYRTSSCCSRAMRFGRSLSFPLPFQKRKKNHSNDPSFLYSLILNN